MYDSDRRAYDARVRDCVVGSWKAHGVLIDEVTAGVLSGDIDEEDEDVTDSDDDDAAVASAGSSSSSASASASASSASS
jgi:hypothetical protein